MPQGLSSASQTQRLPNPLRDRTFLTADKKLRVAADYPRKWYYASV